MLIHWGHQLVLHLLLVVHLGQVGLLIHEIVDVSLDLLRLKLLSFRLDDHVGLLLLLLKCHLHLNVMVGLDHFLMLVIIEYIHIMGPHLHYLLMLICGYASKLVQVS